MYSGRNLLPSISSPTPKSVAGYGIAELLLSPRSYTHETTYIFSTAISIEQSGHIIDFQTGFQVGLLPWYIGLQA